MIKNSLGVGVAFGLLLGGMLALGWLKDMGQILPVLWANPAYWDLGAEVVFWVGLAFLVWLAWRWR